MDLEKFCGLRKYGTANPGVGGEIKTKPEDFRVEEIPQEVEGGEGYLICWMEKTDLTTLEAVSRISSELNISKGRIGYAGLKDKKAVTKQRVSLEGVEKDTGGKLGLEKINLTPSEKSSRPLKPGDLNGNKFEITGRNISLSEKECRGRLEALRKEIAGEGIPNYFGLQRFGGNRPVTHLVGRKLLKREFRESVLTYLTKSFPTEREQGREPRRRLAREEDFSKALDYFPKSLNYERHLLKKITKLQPSREREWVKVLKALPMTLRRLFIHAYQSFIFNSSLSNLLEEKKKIQNFPAKVVGHSMKLTDSKFDQEIKEELGEDGIEPKDFKFKVMEELSSRGAVRAALIENEIKTKEVKEDELNPGKTQATIEFSLNPDRYATVVLREILK